VEREAPQYYHRSWSWGVVSGRFPIPLGLRFLEPGEAELAPGLALVRELKQQLGRRDLKLW